MRISSSLGAAALLGGTLPVPSFAQATRTDGVVLYGVDGAGSLLDVVAHTVGSTGTPSFEGLAWDPASGLLHATRGDTRELYVIDPSTGAASLVGDTGIDAPFGGVSSPLFASGLYVIDKASGASTKVSPQPGMILGLACLPDGAMYASVAGTYAHYLATVDKTTGVVSVLSHTSDVGALASCFLCAEATLIGCGVNPFGSLVLGEGMPSLGDAIELLLDNPLGTQTPGAATYVALATAPDAAAPCGTSIAGLGMSGASAPGELLIDVQAPNPVLVVGGSPWAGPGTPAAIAIGVPAIPALIGARVWAQGMLVDSSGVGPALALTNGAELWLGP